MSVKKILALLLAAMMVFGMTSALAEDPNTKFDVPITKTLYFKNADEVPVYEPNIQYTYTIEGKASGATVTDHDGVTVAVKDGDMRAFGVAAGATKSFVINFSSDHAAVTAKKDGKAAVTKKVTVEFDGSKLTNDAGDIVPGVYRYVITETTNTNQKNAVGISEEGTNVNTLILDIYVKNTGEIAGGKIIDPTDNPGDDPTINNKDKDNNTGKTTGFGDGEEDPTQPESPKDEEGSEKDPEGQLSKTYEATDLPAFYDLYTTYNLTINKQVTGSMGDTANKFPFSTAFTNSVDTAKFTVKVADAAETTPLVSAGAVVGNIKHGENIVITGVPSVIGTNKLSAVTTETNNTEDTYKVTDKFNNIDAYHTEQEVAANGTLSTSAMDLTLESDSVENKVVFTNKLDEISPTGVVLRFAPYFAMFAAGCVLFLILATKRSKKEEE